ncbi:iron-sulfur cluster repair di-iron protein [Halostella sp. JP-L12]|uniref:iron-sulfur cluster repair di-iron protein n=1 Tax=Halostella TaxID=1843185 RepID=UPI000EF78D3F|nr:MULTISPECIES: iron-sulfur cluster repair di-iron protein [Halostella]NHN49158.1 iron-sulfur cluster repair di-iron protein [Halostella sp. JP-L12]
MTETSLDPDRRLGELVTEAPELARALESLGIDYCCGGDRTLAEACAEADLDLSTVRERLADARRTDADERIERESLSALVDDIVSTHHEYLRDELPQLEELVRKVRSVHGENHPELREVESEFIALSEEMRTHTEEEETDAFPVVEKLDRGEPLDGAEAETLRETFEDLEADHDETAARLERIADLTDDYAVPDDACPSYRSMLDRLEALERDTHMHVHKENNVLFEEAEKRLSG